MKQIAFLFILAGFVFLGMGGYQYFKIQAAEKQSMSEATELLKQSPTEAKEAPEDFLPDMGDTVGILEIPTLDAELPIVEGTDPDDLEKGVGHYRGSAYPMQDDQIVLSGHRDTVFRELGDVEIGDTYTMKLTQGT